MTRACVYLGRIRIIDVQADTDTWYSPATIKWWWNPDVPGFVRGLSSKWGLPRKHFQTLLGAMGTQWWRLIEASICVAHSWFRASTNKELGSNGTIGPHNGTIVRASLSMQMGIGPWYMRYVCEGEEACNGQVVGRLTHFYFSYW